MEAFREDCVAYAMFLWARTNGPRELCDMFPDRWDAFRFNCRFGYKERVSVSTASHRPRPPESIPVTMEHNVLLSPTGDGRFVDKATAVGLETAGFTWNAKFADLDNDGFVDLYAVNGWFPGTWRESHVFYRNQGGKRFVDATEDAGLGSFLPTSAYTYVDLHNTGYLDIVAVPTVGPVLVLIFLSWTVIGPLISYYRTGVWIARSQRTAGLPETCVPVFGMLLLLVFGLGTFYFQTELNKVVDRYGGSATQPGTTVPLYA